MASNVKNEMAEPKKLRLSFKRFTSMTFSRRRTTTGIVKEPPPPSPPAPASKSRIPTPAGSSRRHTFFSGSNPLAPRPDSSSKPESQIPRPTTNPPSDGILDVVGEGPHFNQDGRYPSFHNLNPSRSVVEVNQRPSRGPINGPIHRAMMPEDSPSIPNFMRPTSSSAARAPLGNRRRVANISRPRPSRTEPDREGDDILTMKHVSHVDDGTDTVNPANQADQTTENVISYSPPVSQYEIISNVPEDFPTQTSGLSTPTPQNPNCGSYSFSPSDQTIGLALTASIPPGGDIIHKTAAEASEPFNFVMPGRFDSSSEAESRWPLKSSTETLETVIEDRTSPQMDEEGVSALMISTAQPSGYWLGRVTALSDRFRTEAMKPQPPTSSSTPSDFDPESMQDDRRRIGLVFMHLHTLCSTQVAKESLDEFRILYMEKVLGDIGPPSQAKKVREKKGVFEKLMGKKGGAGK